MLSTFSIINSIFMKKMYLIMSKNVIIIFNDRPYMYMAILRVLESPISSEIFLFIIIAV